jgi:hypothetical protein
MFAQGRDHVINLRGVNPEQEADITPAEPSTDGVDASGAVPARHEGLHGVTRVFRLNDRPD